MKKETVTETIDISCKIEIDQDVEYLGAYYLIKNSDGEVMPGVVDVTGVDVKGHWPSPSVFRAAADWLDKTFKKMMEGAE